MGESINMTRASYAKRENGIVPFGADEIADVAEKLGLSNNIQCFFVKNVPDSQQQGDELNENRIMERS